MTETKRFYVVSEEPDRIEPFEDTGALTHYLAISDAGEAILNGYHGETGIRYVLRVTTQVVAEYRRPWTLVANPDVRD